MSFKPSVLAATAVYFGLYYTKEFVSADQVFEIIYKAWKEIVSKILPETNKKEICRFMEVIVSHASSMNYLYGRKLDQIFSQKLVQLLPLYNSSIQPFETSFKMNVDET